MSFRSAFTLATGVILAALLIALSQRYSMVAGQGEDMWLVDRMSGNVSWCASSLTGYCVSAEQSVADATARRDAYKGVRLEDSTK